MHADEGGAAVRVAEHGVVGDADADRGLRRAREREAGAERARRRPQASFVASLFGLQRSHGPSPVTGRLDSARWRPRSASTASAGSGATSTARTCEKNPGFEIVAVNDLAAPDVLAHMLKYDSTHGVLDARDRALGRTRSRSTATPFRVLSERDPSALPWKDMGVDVVVESTGPLHRPRGRLAAPRPPARRRSSSPRPRPTPTSRSSSASTTTSTTPSSTTSSRTRRARRTRSGRWRRSCSTPSGSSRAS